MAVVDSVLKSLPRDTKQWVVEFGRGSDSALKKGMQQMGRIIIPDMWCDTYNPIGTTLAALRFPHEFAVLHLSSDRCLEFMAWRNLDNTWRPAVVVARFDHTKPPGVRSAASRASFTTMVELGESKGYAVAGFDSPFLIFILKTRVTHSQR